MSSRADMRKLDLLRRNRYTFAKNSCHLFGVRGIRASMKLQGKRVLVTGGDQGIGRGIALRFAREGADVAIDYLSDPAHADETVAEIVKLGRKAVAVQGDVSILPELQRLFDQATQQFGPIDVLVNNAG